MSENSGDADGTSSTVMCIYFFKIREKGKM